MFDSGVKALNFINALKSEADIAPDIPTSYFIDWLNEVEQTLYDNVIREERYDTDEITASGSGNIEKAISYPVMGTGIADLRFEDILSVVIDKRSLAKVSLNAGKKHVFVYSFWKNDDGAITTYIPASPSPRDAILTYTIRPLLKNDDNIDTETVKVPAEFLDMVRAKIRGEAYKFANEDALAAKWLNDYNQQLEYFRAWIASKSPTFGA